MEYLEQMQSGFKYLVSAGEAGRRSLDGMLGPVNGAISEITGAAAELENLPFIPDGVGEKLQRVMRGVGAAQAKVGAVVETYSRASRAASQIDERLGVLKEQAAKAGAAINQVTFSQLPVRVVLPDPRMSLALPRITMVSGGPDASTSSTT